MRARFGRELRGFVTAAGAPQDEDAFALSFFVTAAMTYLALRADAVPDHCRLRLDREADWQRIERMLERLATRMISPAPAPAPAPAARAAAGKVSASAPGARPPRRQP